MTSSYRKHLSKRSSRYGKQLGAYQDRMQRQAMANQLFGSALNFGTGLANAGLGMWMQNRQAAEAEKMMSALGPLMGFGGGSGAGLPTGSVPTGGSLAMPAEWGGGGASGLPSVPGPMTGGQRGGATLPPGFWSFFVKNPEAGRLVLGSVMSREQSNLAAANDYLNDLREAILREHGMEVGATQAVRQAKEIGADELASKLEELKPGGLIAQQNQAALEKTRGEEGIKHEFSEEAADTAQQRAMALKRDEKLVEGLYDLMTGGRRLRTAQAAEAEADAAAKEWEGKPQRTFIDPAALSKPEELADIIVALRQSADPRDRKLADDLTSVHTELLRLGETKRANEADEAAAEKGGEWRGLSTMAGVLDALSWANLSEGEDVPEGALSPRDELMQQVLSRMGPLLKAALESGSFPPPGAEPLPGAPKGRMTEAEARARVDARWKAGKLSNVGKPD